MSLRRFVTKFGPQNQFYPTLRWNQIAYARAGHRTLHISRSHGCKQKLQYPPEISCTDVINQVIPPHELENQKNVTVDDWRSNCDSFKDAKMFRTILTELLRRRLYDAGKSYIEMIKMYEPHILSPFNEIYVLRFIIHKYPNFSPCTDEDDIKCILETYSKIKKAFPVLDYFSAETLVLAMQKTSQWRVALELLDDMSLLQKPKARVYCAIIVNALREKDSELAWSFMDKMKDFYLSPDDECWMEWLALCRQSGLTEWKDGAGRMLEYFYSHHIQMSVDVANELTKFIDDLCPNYCVKQSSIQKSKCLECSTRLHTEFSTSDHADLKEMIQKIISHDSLYASTTPIEMNNFRKFIENCAPYDIVIDGLNAIYSRRGISRTDIESLKHSLNLRILFLGRIHLANRKDFKQIANMCQVFLCENLTRDDVYVLYSAIYHRPDVKFLSEDKMRSQFYYLIDDLRRNLFLRWQHLNQSEHGRFLSFQHYLPEIHKSSDGTYHIPCVANSPSDLTWTPADAKYWLCVRPGPKATKPSKPIPTDNDPTLYKPESKPQVNADGSTIVDDLVERLQLRTKFSVRGPENLDEDVPVELKEKKPVKGLIRGFQKKYRQVQRQYPEQKNTWLSDSLCQNEVDEKDVILNLKKRFKEMHKSENEKNDDNQKNSPTGKDR